MREITAQEFYKEFIKKINENKDEVKKLYYHNSQQNEPASNNKNKNGETDWTIFVNRKIIPEIINSCLTTNKKTNHKYTYQEFYKIDNTGWSYIDMEDIDQPFQNDFINTGMNYHLWNLEIAVEHENDPKDWFYEVIKLLPFDCKLRIVIGYNNIQNRQTDNGSSDEKKLEILLKQIKLLDNGINKLKHGTFLIILGNTGDKLIDDIEKMCGYNGYIFDPSQEKFVELENE